METAPRIFSRREVYGALQEAFGHEEFRVGQPDVVRSILQGRETITVLPTGGGKSLCYQLPALLFEGTSLIISPLIALMRDQVMALRARGVAAASLDSNQDYGERRDVEHALAEGQLKLLYVSPERLGSERFLDLVSSLDIPFVAVDEAHCVVRWGHEFRSAYLEIGPFLQRLQPRHVAAFTATATPELRDELGSALGMADPVIYVRGFFRENIHLAAERCDSDAGRLDRLLELVKAREGSAPALVYGATRAACEETAAFLRADGLRAEHYHAGCEPQHRRDVQDAFLADEIDAMVATNAFGMGIDKPDLRLLVHVSLPPSFEDYYQEVGRAGRDGLDSNAVLLWRGSDYRTRSFLAEQQENPVSREAALRRLNRLYQTLRGRGCLWRRILEYFGDPQARELGDGCGACTRCLDGDSDLHKLEGDAHENAVAALACLLEVDGALGRKKIAGILKGSAAQGVPDWHKAFGSLKRLTLAAIEELLQSLLDSGYAAVRGTEYPTLGISREGLDALHGGGDIVVLGAPEPSRTARRKEPAEPAWDEADPALVSALKEWRAEQARERGVPPYVVLHDKSIAALAARRPATLPELLEIPGIGPAKAESFGEALLGLVSADPEA
ncbi:MAG: RecQ family ATP-dependent DNA helicase [Planctomycetota bacterium]